MGPDRDLLERSSERPDMAQLARSESGPERQYFHPWRTYVAMPSV
jgi:hypothetical protein